MNNSYTQLISSAGIASAGNNTKATLGSLGQSAVKPLSLHTAAASIPLQNGACINTGCC
jgi:hypothetical protein